MSNEELIQELRRLMQEHDPEGRFSDEELTGYINRASRRVATDLKLLIDEAEVAVPAGERSASLPPDYIAFDEWFDEPGEGVEIRGNQVLLRSPLDEDLVLSFRYFRLPEDVSEIPDRHHDGVLLAAHLLALESEDAAPDPVLASKIERAEARYMRWLALAEPLEAAATYREPTRIEMWRRR